jgi:hypothetical protein
MQRDKLRSSLEHLGIAQKDYRVLKLLPLVHVAWASGNMEPLRRERIHSFAARHYELGASAMALLEDWLSHPPSRDYVIEGLRDIRALAGAVDDLEIDSCELPSIVSYAEGIARTTSGHLDQPEAVTTPEQQALREIAEELRVDHGATWAELLRELR